MRRWQRLVRAPFWRTFACVCRSGLVDLRSWGACFGHLRPVNDGLTAWCCCPLFLFLSLSLVCVGFLARQNRPKERADARLWVTVYIYDSGRGSLASHGVARARPSLRSLAKSPGPEGGRGRRGRAEGVRASRVLVWRRPLELGPAARVDLLSGCVIRVVFGSPTCRHLRFVRSAHLVWPD